MRIGIVISKQRSTRQTNYSHLKICYCGDCEKVMVVLKGSDGASDWYSDGVLVLVVSLLSCNGVVVGVVAIQWKSSDGGKG